MTDPLEDRLRDHFDRVGTGLDHRSSEPIDAAARARSMRRRRIGGGLAAFVLVLGGAFAVRGDDARHPDVQTVDAVEDPEPEPATLEPLGDAEVGAAVAGTEIFRGEVWGARFLPDRVQLSRSADGLTWRDADPAAPADNDRSIDIAANDDRLVVVRSGPAGTEVSTSTDGETWSRTTVSEAPALLSHGQARASDDHVFVAVRVADEPTIEYLEAQLELDERIAERFGSREGIALGAQLVGDEWIVTLWSDDEEIFVGSYAELGVSPEAVQRLEDRPGDVRFDLTVLASADGEVWTELPLPPGIGDDVGLPDTDNGVRLVSAGRQWLAVDTAGWTELTARPDDEPFDRVVLDTPLGTFAVGAHWGRRSASPSTDAEFLPIALGSLDHLAASDHAVVLASDGALWVTVDGETYASVPLPDGSRMSTLRLLPDDTFLVIVRPADLDGYEAYRLHVPEVLAGAEVPSLAVMPELAGSSISILDEDGPFQDLYDVVGPRVSRWVATGDPVNTISHVDPPAGTPLDEVDGWTVTVSSGQGVPLSDLPTDVQAFAATLEGYDKSESVLVFVTEHGPAYKTDAWLYGTNCDAVDAAYRRFHDPRYDVACPSD